MKVSGNKILITGATAGIGKALTLKFLSLGNTIIAAGRNKESLQELAKIDSRIIPVVCDLSKMSELEKLTLQIENVHPDLNILINNAGIQYNYQFTEEEYLINKIDHEINVNFIAPLKLIAFLLPVLQMNENAAIVNVSSGIGLVPKMQAPVYCGTKAGIHIFSQSLRYQLQTTKVFEMIPPLVDTEMTKGRGKGKISAEQVAEEFIKAFSKNQYEINIGKVKLLKLINRISPKLAQRIMKNGK
ncbi:SDR family oxidoreductase [Lacibacter sp. H407]|uniref:SDR family oxidoreductase n=1 Tax=Lacibacter sp. H407 TaxID=3133423 RepID=UPI0030BB1E8C